MRSHCDTSSLLKIILGMEVVQRRQDKTSELNKVVLRLAAYLYIVIIKLPYSRLYTTVSTNIKSDIHIKLKSIKNLQKSQVIL